MFTDPNRLPPLLQVEHVSHHYPDGGTSVSNVSFNVCKGEFIVLAGANGSGKTTLLRLLNGLLHPSAGDIRYRGKPIIKNPEHTRKHIGMVFQDPDTQIVGETVFDDTAFGPENLKLPREEIDKTVHATLDSLGLGHMKDRCPSTLSGGEKRRLALSGILVMHPEIILLDEPFSNLDYPGAAGLLQLLEFLNRDGITLIAATHDVEKIIDKAGRMIIMQNGTIVADGPPSLHVQALEQYGIREPCASRYGMKPADWVNGRKRP
ncbi:MAG: energy-coupling factor ABC transporter ATP-binding protein [Desulfarculaceae bacterium]|nr:energy-coupling factor ABC transporter ATP-binding protein [Desulfarculaceae bacterium]